jgi:hypothetical protein
VVNADWIAPPTNSKAVPLTQVEGQWNTRPGDQFVPHGRSPLGPYGYSTAASLLDLNPQSKIGSGIFWVRLARGKTLVVTTVSNPTTQEANFSVAVNGARVMPTNIPAQAIITLKSALPVGATEVSVRYTGDKNLVILETTFE